MFIKELTKTFKSVARGGFAEVFSAEVGSKNLGKIAVVNDSYIIESTAKFDAEMLSHIPFFVEDFTKNDASKRVLLFNSMNLELAQAFLGLGASVGLVQSDNASLEFLAREFFKNEQIFSHQNFQKVANVIDLDFVKCNIIVAEQSLNSHQLDGICRLLESDGILIFRAKNPLTDLASFKKNVSEAAEFFRVVMPFVLPYTMGQERYFVFASKRFHPLADLRLQKVDLLESRLAYNAKMHAAVFALPEFLVRELKGVAKN